MQSLWLWRANGSACSSSPISYTYVVRWTAVGAPADTKSLSLSAQNAVSKHSATSRQDSDRFRTTRPAAGPREPERSNQHFHTHFANVICTHPSGLPTKIVYAILISLMLATCPARPTLLDHPVILSEAGLNTSWIPCQCLCPFSPRICQHAVGKRNACSGFRSPGLLPPAHGLFFPKDSKICTVSSWRVKESQTTAKQGRGVDMLLRFTGPWRWGRTLLRNVENQ